MDIILFDMCDEGWGMIRGHLYSVITAITEFYAEGS